MGTRWQKVKGAVFDRLTLLTLVCIDGCFVLALLVVMGYVDKARGWLFEKIGALGLMPGVAFLAVEILLDLGLLFGVFQWIIKDMQCTFQGDCEEADV